LKFWRTALDALPRPTSTEDRQAIRNARRTYDHGGLDEARKTLAALSVKNPDDGEVHFLLGIIQARLGAFGAACEELAPLLEKDLISFGPRLESETTLSAFRESAIGGQLRAHATAVGTLWRAAISSGLPAILTQGTRRQMDIWRPSSFRAGIYLHEAARFLPLAPVVSGASAALIDPGNGSVAVAKTIVTACHTDFCPRMTSAEALVFRIDDWARSPRHWEYREPESSATQIDLRSGPDGVSVSMTDCCCWKNCKSPWSVIEKGRPIPRQTPDRASRGLSIDHRGALLDIRPDHFRIEHGRLRPNSGAEIVLSREHGDHDAVHSILVDRRGREGLVFSAVDRCECTNGREKALLSYVVSTIDLSAGKATVLLHGDGTGAALLDGSDAVYVQIGDTVRRWHSVASMRREAGIPILTGVLLVPPRSPRRDCCGL
jgi:hypothetical protein